MGCVNMSNQTYQKITYYYYFILSGSPFSKLKYEACVDVHTSLRAHMHTVMYPSLTTWSHLDVKSFLNRTRCLFCVCVWYILAHYIILYYIINFSNRWHENRIEWTHQHRLVKADLRVGQDRKWATGNAQGEDTRSHKFFWDPV